MILLQIVGLTRLGTLLQLGLRSALWAFILWPRLTELAVSWNMFFPWRRSNAPRRSNRNMQCLLGSNLEPAQVASTHISLAKAIHTAKFNIRWESILFPSKLRERSEYFLINYIIYYIICVRVPNTTQWFGDSLEGFMDHIFTGMVYYGTSSLWKGTKQIQQRVKSREIKSWLPGVSPRGFTQDTLRLLQLQCMTIHSKCHQSGKFGWA